MTKKYKFRDTPGPGYYPVQSDFSKGMTNKPEQYML